jgi:hypothetical protein
MMNPPLKTFLPLMMNLPLGLVEDKSMGKKLEVPGRLQEEDKRKLFEQLWMNIQSKL